DKLVVEDVESLIFHRAHVEIGHRDNHESIEVVFPAERGLVPAHGALERLHRVGAARLFARLYINPERHISAGPGAKAVFDTCKPAADESKQIGRLWERIVPERKVTPGTRNIAGRHEITI